MPRRARPGRQTRPAAPPPPPAPDVHSRCPVATVRIPTVLRKHTDGEAKIAAEGATVREVFRGVVDAHPGLADSLFDGDEVRGFINVYVDDEDIRYLDGLDSKVAPADEIAIMPAVAGGAG
ncbi:MoaD/ThiS family protein [Nitriliruptoraceae bacterium ZYF776]|nr:MoaD/ThiS family protein [Profundirhabdus halotolerans]